MTAMSLSPKDNHCSQIRMFLTSLFLKAISFSELEGDLDIISPQTLISLTKFTGVGQISSSLLWEDNY